MKLVPLLSAALLAAYPVGEAFSKEQAVPVQATAGKQVTGEVTLKESVEATLKSHRGLKVMQENLDVVRHELRKAKAGWGPSVDAVAARGSAV